MKKNKTTLTLMCGLARCGKSTWIKRNKGDAIVVSPDDVRIHIFGHQFHKNAEDFIWAFSKSMAKLLLEQGKDVIIDATNFNRSSRGDWIRIAEEYNSKVKIIWIKTSLKKCKERNNKSKEGQKLPDSVLDKMATFFQDPYYSEEYYSVPIELIMIPKNKKSKKSKDELCSSNFYQDQVIKKA